MPDLTTNNCVSKSGPVTKPCACATVCASKYGVEVRRLRAAIGEVPQKDVKAHEEAVRQWRQFIADHAPHI